MDRSDLESETLVQLRPLAKELGISNIIAMKKAELIDAILEKQKDGGAPAAPPRETPVAARGAEAPAREYVPRGTREYAPR
ncbi:MAG: Rho termination factor N-terminal domain-containing protein, partial [Chloroflexi bacterium]|nr:Rho termination factor N-terminal domain-containing protein [Chloroflexota bacterium]